MVSNSSRHETKRLLIQSSTGTLVKRVEIYSKYPTGASQVSSCRLLRMSLIPYDFQCTLDTRAQVNICLVDAAIL